MLGLELLDKLGGTPATKLIDKLGGTPATKLIKKNSGKFAGQLPLAHAAKKANIPIYEMFKKRYG